MAVSVLIVDDSPAMRKYVRRVLELAGIAAAPCREAADGLEALHLLHKERTDLILTDINMPVMNGEELLRNIETSHDLKEIPVVVISTDSSENRLQQMMSLGARGYVAKPFQPEDLRREVERALGTSVTEDALATALQAAVARVIETMFFSTVIAAEETAGAEVPVAACLDFSGNPPGTFGLSASPLAAREMAANFLGEDEIGEEQTREVIRELANMVCGSLLSTVEQHSHFELGDPRIVEALPLGGLRRSYTLDSGTINVFLETRP